MTTSQYRFYTVAEAAERLGFTPAALSRVARKHPGFAVQLLGSYRIPAEHIDRVLKGERPDVIAAEVRAGGAARAA